MEIGSLLSQSIPGRHRLPDALRTLPRFEPDNDLWVFREGSGLPIF